MQFENEKIEIIIFLYLVFTYFICTVLLVGTSILLNIYIIIIYTYFQYHCENRIKFKDYCVIITI